MEIGTIGWLATSSGFEVIKLLSTTGDNWYIRTYWPLASAPSHFDENELDIRTTCSISSPILDLHTIGFESISEADQQAIIQFESIRSAKDFRLTHFEQLIEQAYQAKENGNNEEAIWKINEAAPFAKLDGRVYALRAACFIALNRIAEATIDVQFLEELDPTHPSIQELKKQL